ncbi:hypothetical protein MRB53_041609 [Persea americana]|nr:hypothetical protein MRB53_041609 [Persea americana]
MQDCHVDSEDMASVAAIRAAKAALRQCIKEKLAGLSQEGIGEQSHQVCRRVLALNEWKAARRVGIYLSMRRELQTRALVLDAFEAGKEVFVPFVYKTRRSAIETGGEEKIPTMDMLALRDLNDYEGLKEDAWGIPSLGRDSVADEGTHLEGMD